MDSLKNSKLFSVQGKTCVVTGGSVGIGLMFSAAYVANGARVIMASRKEKQLKETCDQLNAMGPGRCEYIVADIGTRQGCDQLCAEIKKRAKKIHVLVNNSGVTWGAPYADFPEKEGWDRVMALNVKSIFYMTSSLTDLLAANASNIDPGRVIIISSVAGLDHVAEGALSGEGQGTYSYPASKAAALHLGKTLATTLAPKLITVNTVCPGVYKSRMTAFGVEKHGDALVKAQPMGRIGETEDMAGLAIFLASRASAHISGAAIPTDGGSLVTYRNMTGFLKDLQKGAKL